MSTLTPKARAALTACARGAYPGTRQMVYRLSGLGLIDFDPRNGWFVTESGHAALREVKV